MADTDEKSAYASLSKRHKAFVDELALGRVQWKAYRDKVYSGSENPTYYTLSSAASRLAADVNIQAAIAERAALFQMSREEALKRTGDLARSTPEHFVKDGLNGQLEVDLTTEEAKDHLHLLKEIKQKRRILTSEGDEGEEIRVLEIETEIKLHDAGTNLDRVLKVHGAYGAKGTADDPNVVYNIDYSALSDEQIERLANGEHPRTALADKGEGRTGTP